MATILFRYSYYSLTNHCTRWLLSSKAGYFAKRGWELDWTETLRKTRLELAGEDYKALAADRSIDCHNDTFDDGVLRCEYFHFPGMSFGGAITFRSKIPLWRACRSPTVIQLQSIGSQHICTEFPHSHDKQRTAS